MSAYVFVKYFFLRSAFLFLFYVIQKTLEDFDLNDLLRLHFVIDRGSNLVKALKPYRSLYCYGHRLNNVLKRSFCQSNKKKRKNETANIHVQAPTVQSNTKRKDSDLSTSTSDDDIETVLPIAKRKMKTKITAGVVQSITTDPRKLELTDMEPAAQKVIETIVNC